MISKARRSTNWFIGRLEPGEYKFHLNAKDYPAGTYTVNLHTDEHGVSKKIILH